MNLKTSFRLQRASDVLSKVRDVATALAFAGGRLTPLSALGIAAHLAGFLVGMASKDLSEVARTWTRMNLAAELHRCMRDALLPATRSTVNDWMHCEVDGQGVLVNMGSDHTTGTFFAERDVVAVEAWLREETWKRHGSRITLAPVGRWGDSVDLRATPPAPTLDSPRAREVWRRIRPMFVAGEPRSVLLDGKPRTGKSTIARQVLALAEAERGGPLSALRISVSDFAYLTPSVVEAVVQLLQPDALVLDDIDRFAGADQLLDLFETIRAPARLIITTCNNSEKLPQALRLPGRIDEVLVVDGAGPDLAGEVMGPRWRDLDDKERAQVAGWPVKLVDELRIRLECLATPLATEVAELQRRLDGAALALQGSAGGSV